MTSQKHLFDLPDDIHYLNGAYMSPLMKSVQEAGIEGIKRKTNPSSISSDDFFNLAEEVKLKFGRIIHAPASQIAIIPSASYGLKSAVENIPLNTGTHAVVIANEFPSDYNTVAEWCKKNKKALKVIEAPKMMTGRAQIWTDKILEQINKETCAVVLSAIDWSDGTKFDLKIIGKKCKENNARFIVDGTQSVGAMPMDVVAFSIDALICAAYKWLMGPYSIGLAYYSEFYNKGIPIEDSWMNKSNANDFTKLTHYVDDYKAGAARYNVGEFSNFILLPMLDKALQQIAEWDADAIQDYCGNLINPLLNFLQENEYWFEENKYRANHLFGFLLSPLVNKEKLLLQLQSSKVFVSLRGDAIRVSPHLYNEAPDIEALIEVLKSNNR
jgi:selenocysteine lyase/cysteine desulfurase